MNNHKYSALADDLRAKIHKGDYEIGEKLPSENTLAEQTGYSRQTVRQAMSLLMSEGLIYCVQGSGTFVKRKSAYHAPTYNAAVVTTYISEYIFPDILKGIEYTLSRHGYTSMLSATYNRVDNERKILLDLLQKPIDGLIVEGTKTALPNPNIDLYDQFSDKGIPVVFINGYYPELKSPVYVVADDRKGGAMACKYLLRKGHTSIAGIFKSDDLQGHFRYAGYATALREQGLTVNDDNVMWYSTENRESLLAAETEKILHGCSAVICYNDEVALQVVRILNEQGVRVPQDIAVISFDDSTYAQLAPVRITSLANDKEKLGCLAAEKLIGILQNKTGIPAVLPWTISEKAST